jgi:hypothetical protein
VRAIRLESEAFRRECPEDPVLYVLISPKHSDDYD